MIWVSDAANPLIYVSPEWTDLTGQSRAEANGLGWIDPIHEDDRAIARATYREASRASKPYALEFRVRRASGGYQWMASSARPSIQPEDQRFLGYYGALRTVEPAAAFVTATGRVGRFQTPEDLLAAAPPTVVENLADQLILAHDLARHAGEAVLLEILNIALFEVGRRLAEESQRRPFASL